MDRRILDDREVNDLMEEIAEGMLQAAREEGHRGEALRERIEELLNQAAENHTGHCGAHQQGYECPFDDVSETLVPKLKARLDAIPATMTKEEIDRLFAEKLGGTD